MTSIGTRPDAPTSESGRSAAERVQTTAPDHTGSPGTRVYGLIGILGLIFVTVMGLLVTAPDTELGERVRPIYVHVPTVTTAYLMFGIVALGSVMYLWKRSQFWDFLAASAAEVGVLMIGLTLVTGSIWGRLAWGTWWQWDGRMTSTLMLGLVFASYLALRASVENPQTRATQSAVVGIAGVMLIPVVHKSVDWWHSLHADRTVLGTFDPKLEGQQLFTLMVSFLVFLAIGIWMLIHRFRIAVLDDRAEGVQLVEAMAERRNEGEVSK